MSEEELRERLAAIEHERWSDWQRYLHSRLKKIIAFVHDERLEGMLMSPADYIHWEEQIAAEYSELTEAEKQSDRDQVDRYWPIVKEYANSRELEGRIDELDDKLPKVMGYENVTPVIASNVSKRIEELESQKEKTNE